MFSKSKLSISLFALLLTPALGNASYNHQAIHYAFLKNGFNMQAYTTCHTQLKKCPQVHGNRMVDDTCVAKTIDETPDCQQLNKLAKKVNGTLGLLTAEPASHHFVIITQQYIADGQQNYYIVSPLGYLVETNIDPRSINSDLKKRYSTADFFTKTFGAIKIESTSNGSMHFTVPLQITKTCSACELIGLAKVQYNFSSKGKPMKTKLISFDTENIKK